MGPKGAGVIHWKLVLQKRVEGRLSAICLMSFQRYFQKLKKNFMTEEMDVFPLGKEFLSHSCGY